MKQRIRVALELIGAAVLVWILFAVVVWFIEALMLIYIILKL